MLYIGGKCHAESKKETYTYSEPEVMRRTLRCGRMKRMAGDKWVEVGMKGEGGGGEQVS